MKNNKPEVMEEAWLNVHNFGLGVLVRDDILLAPTLLLAVLPHPQEVLVHTPQSVFNIFMKL